MLKFPVILLYISYYDTWNYLVTSSAIGFKNNLQLLNTLVFILISVAIWFYIRVGYLSILYRQYKLKWVINISEKREKKKGILSLIRGSFGRSISQESCICLPFFMKDIRCIDALDSIK